MSTRALRRPARSLAAVLAVAALLVTAACSDDEPSADSAVAVTTSAAPEPLTAEQLATVVRTQNRGLKQAVRRFEKCESSGIAGYGFNTCWRRTLPATVAAAGFAETLRAAGAPPTYSVVLSRLDRLAAARAVIRKGCSKGDDQKCDQALMRFRDDAQKVQWELELV